MYCCCLGLLFAVVVVGGAAAADSCYSFMGDSYLEFSTSSLNISGGVHYNLTFRTTEPSGILLYSEGPDDYEGLYIYNGKLVYLLTNPSPSGVEGTTGGFYQSTVNVDDGSWFTVELLRNWVTEREPPLTGKEMRTGFVLYKDTTRKVDMNMDHLNHRGVYLNPVIYVGGISSSVVYAQGSHVPPFKGQIKNMRDGLDFTSPSLNYEMKVKLCS